MESKSGRWILHCHLNASWPRMVIIMRIFFIHVCHHYNCKCITLRIFTCNNQWHWYVCMRDNILLILKLPLPAWVYLICVLVPHRRPAQQRRWRGPTGAISSDTWQDTCDVNAPASHWYPAQSACWAHSARGDTARYIAGEHSEPSSRVYIYI